MLLPDQPNVSVLTKNVPPHKLWKVSVTTAVPSLMIPTLFPRFHLVRIVEALQLFRALMLARARVPPAAWVPLSEELLVLARIESRLSEKVSSSNRPTWRINS